MLEIPIGEGTYLAKKWTKYMHSAEHEREKARSRKLNEEDEEAVNKTKAGSGIENAGAFTQAPALPDEKREHT